MNRFIILLLVVLSLSSCKKIIDIDIKNAKPILVIEGNLVDEFGIQQIKISKTVALDNENIFPKVSGAAVKITDNLGNEFVFLESKPGFYIKSMKGIAGRTYNLSVEVEGQKYTASSTMPKKVLLDSIGILKTNLFGKERRNVAAFYKDPAADLNFYRYYLYVNYKLVKNIFVSNDRLTNGNLIRQQFFYNSDDIEELKKGDIVDLEMLNIDANIFDYWYSLSQQVDRGPNQNTTPSNPSSNIIGGALGYFSAQAYQIKTITVK